MKTTIMLLCALAGSPALASPTNHSCAAQTCAAGTKGVTYATKTEPYFACPTRELATYTAFVLGLISMSEELTGKPPNISDKTGEPEYLDDSNGPNRTRLMLDSLRADAKVNSLDQAVSLCAKGPSKAPVMVLNNPADEIVLWVHDEKRNVSYWMPKTSLDKR